MKHYNVLVTLMIALSSSLGYSMESSHLGEVFARPVIIGASVSSGLKTPGPGNVAAEQFVSRSSITNVARSGAEGKEFTFVSTRWAQQYSVIIAVDFLFWDSQENDVTASVRALQNLISSAARAHVPLVLGDIPLLLPFQASRDVLNQKIHSLCHASAGCHVLPLDQFHERAVSQGIVIDGHRYFYNDLTVDGIHINSIASEYLARIIIRLLSH